MIHSLAMFAAAAPGVWTVLFDIMILLAMALLFGTLAERLGQSAIVGYLIAGTLVGPNVLGWISTQGELVHIAELGVALLLFAIGLEFSPRRLLSLGPSVFKTGVLQVVLTIPLGFAGAFVCGLDAREALVVGMILTVSSTACVLRMLSDRAEIDSEHGRLALGILLIQDAAVIPMMLLLSVMATGGSLGLVVGKLGIALALAALLLGFFYALFNIVVPRLLLLPTWNKNRDLPILMAVIIATGSALATHEFGLSPALGAFAAGVLLAVSPFATQIRADTRPLTTILVTMFFAAIGMFGDPVWLMTNWNWAVVVAIVLAILLGKPLVIALLGRAFGRPWRYAIAAGLCLGQVGEFSFVLAAIAQSSVDGTGLISQITFRTIVSATIATLLLTPYLIAAAPWLGARGEQWLLGRTGKKPTVKPSAAQMPADRRPASDLILILGFGPAGQRVAEGLLDSHKHRMIAIDLNSRNIDIAERYGLAGYIGDARHRDVLEHAGIYHARAVVITVPDHATTRHLIHLVRDLVPSMIIVARCRYHILHWELLHAGADEVVDEENQLGSRLAALVRKLVGNPGET